MADRFAPSSTASPSAGGLALRFISGKYQGGEFPIEPGKEIVIGRSSGLEMVLVEEMVSRKHAKITATQNELVIEDMGSTNGTFVNGEKVKRAVLREGDRVLIGTSILKVVASANTTTQSQAQQSLESLAAKKASENKKEAERGGGQARMTGTVDEIPLPDLLQLFATSKKNGVLVVRTDADTGRIYLTEGVVHYCQIQSKPELPPLKAVYRMLTWRSGVFELDPPEEVNFSDPLDETVQAILMEGFRQQDELGHLRPKLPASDAQLGYQQPLGTKLRELSPTELDVFQVVLESGGTIDQLMDRSSLTDLQTAEAVVQLVKKNVIETK